MSKRVLVAAPRSFCAGVVRAIDIVEKLLETHGPPVYVRHQIVHNVHVVRDLEARGAIFVETEQEVPEGALVVLSAHGVAPQVYRKCAERNLKVIDATCPLVSKVHAEARRYAARGLKIALVGHAGHEEVVGTMGEAPDSIVLVETVEDAERLELEDGQRVAYLTQTTLSVDDTGDVVDALRDRFPDLVGPPSADICYATQNRQDAVKKICEQATLVLVVGSKTSSNANRLVEVARDLRRRRVPDRRRDAISTRHGSTATRPSGSRRAPPRRRCSSTGWPIGWPSSATSSARRSSSPARTSTSACRRDFADRPRFSPGSRSVAGGRRHAGVPPPGTC